MKLFAFILMSAIFISNGLSADEYENISISFDPLTVVGILFLSLVSDESEPVEIGNIWLSMDINMGTNNQRETGFGAILRANRIAIKTHYRSFYNKEKQSGFFYGLYGLIEWRKMYWVYDENNELVTGWIFPFIGNDNVYHSIGITAGLDIGFRFRKDDIGITPYFGLGIPLFYCFGDLPPASNIKDFYLVNAVWRAINIGLKIDFFQRKTLP